MASTNPQNLKPQNLRSEEERKEIARKGGKASGESRRRAKQFKQYIKAALNGEIEVQGEVSTVKDAMARKVIQQALKGNLKATELILKVIEENPAEKIELQGKLNNVLRVEFCPGTGQTPVIEDS